MPSSKTKKQLNYTPAGIELNEQFRQALDSMENSRDSIFITGRAGTGKSTLLEYFRTHTKKILVILAPTGVAAVNVRGQTVHSFFGFKPDITLSKVKKLPPHHERGDLFRTLETIVIDEVSMMRADLLDCVDRFMRLNGRDRHQPFGGVQMILIGDLYQLPPVVTSRERAVFSEHYPTPYFFSAHALNDQNLLHSNFQLRLIELEKIYRQKDQQFIDLLNAVRNNSVTDEHLNALNARFEPAFHSRHDDFYIYLTATNADARRINEERLMQLHDKLYEFEARVGGNIEDSTFPTDAILHLKRGAQVMLLNNDSAGRWVNGTIGTVKEIAIEEDEEGNEHEVVKVTLASGTIVDVLRFRWDIFNYTFDRVAKVIDTELIGSFTQLPLRLAWAITIHKSQGKTFERVIVDIGRGTFAHGQMYVALSRCTTLPGLVLKQKLEKRHIWMDWAVVKFLTGFQYQLAEQTHSLADKRLLLEAVQSSGGTLTITYLKANDTKSRRHIRPLEIADMEFQNKKFLGVRAYCLERKAERIFRVDRILEIQK